MLDTFGVPALFAISGMNNVDSARSAIPKSPGSPAGAFITASPPCAGWFHWCRGAGVFFLSERSIVWEKPRNTIRSRPLSLN
jgi:hypothetical protein